MGGPRPPEEQAEENVWILPIRKMEQVTGIEPASPAWKAGALTVVLHLHWMRGQESNLRPPAYEAGKLPLLHTPRYQMELVDGLEPPTY